jgi:hypothetical protein
MACQKEIAAGTKFQAVVKKTVESTEGRLVGLKEISDYARMGITAIRDKINCNGFPAVMIGNKWVSYKSRIDGFLAAEFDRELKQKVSNNE